jgi:uncharacterized protein (TIGR02391 family)
MSSPWRVFERIVRNAARFTDAPPLVETQHPFEVRNIHSALPSEVKRLFDNTHYAQATFEAFKFLDNEVKRHTGLDKTGKALMMEALREVSPLVELTPLSTDTERNEQEGYKFIFAGSMMAIRNPRGHEHTIHDDVDTCLDHLTLVSHLIRRLSQAGYHPTAV